MSYVQYPSKLPLPQPQYAPKLITNSATTQMSSGRVRRRRLGNGKYYSVKFNWLLSPAERDYFFYWWENSLKFGAMPFEVTMATGYVEGVHKIQLSGDPDESLDNCNYRVSCDAVIIEKPEFTAQQISDFEAGLIE